MAASALALSSVFILMVSPVLPVTMFEKMVLLPVSTKHLLPATTIAIIINADQILLTAIKDLLKAGN